MMFGNQLVEELQNVTPYYVCRVVSQSEES